MPPACLPRAASFSRPAGPGYAGELVGLAIGNPAAVIGHELLGGRRAARGVQVIEGQLTHARRVLDSDEGTGGRVEARHPHHGDLLALTKRPAALRLRDQGSKRQPQALLQMRMPHLHDRILIALRGATHHLANPFPLLATTPPHGAVADLEFGKGRPHIGGSVTCGGRRNLISCEGHLRPDEPLLLTVLDELSGHGCQCEAIPLNAHQHWSTLSLFGRDGADTSLPAPDLAPRIGICDARFDYDAVA